MILASQSQTRILLLKNAGIEFDAVAAHIDELELHDQHKNLSPENLAPELAKAKAVSVLQQYPSKPILGADQVLACDGKIFHKAKSLDEARQQLKFLRGKPHHLHTAVVCVQNHDVLFRHVETATMHMRQFSDRFLDHYLHSQGLDILSSVGCYHYERQGIQLFEKIQGDYFTILGLPLIPLLAFLRQSAMIKT